LTDHFHVPLSDTQPEPFSEAEVAVFALRSGWIDDLGVIAAGRTVIERRALSWWPGHDLIIARDPSWNSNVAAWVLKEGGRLIRLSGKSGPVHAINQSVKPIFTSDNVLAYLGFFCLFVHGEAGPFGIVRSIDDGLLPADLDREKIALHLREPAIVKQTPDAAEENAASFDIEAPIYYGDALFLSNFRVFPTGMVEMLADEPLVSELEAVITMPLRFEVPKAAPETEMDEQMH